jgi:iron complex transport system permease protein
VLERCHAEAHAVKVKTSTLLATLAVLSLTLGLLSLGIGSNGWSVVGGAWVDPTAARIVWDIRLPRTLTALLAGALLGLSGALAQGLFRNPLADPYLLGSASGASLGVTLVWLGLGSYAGSVSWWARMGVTGGAFVGAVAGVLLTLALAKGVQHTLRLLLAGVIVGVLLGAVKELVLLMRPDLLQTMQSFMLGSTGLAGWDACVIMGVVCVLCTGLAWALAPVLDGLALGEATAISLGLDLVRLRSVLIGVLALATGAAVAHTGLIAFIGLAAPHVVRSLVKVGHRRLVVLSAWMGGVLLLVSDMGARGLVAPLELPVGVLTSVVGGTYLLWLMHRRLPGKGLW